MQDEKNSSSPLLCCPWCYDIADAIAIDSDGEVILLGCCRCNFQGLVIEFIDISTTNDLNILVKEKCDG